MDSFTIAIAAAGLLIYSLFSGRLQGTVITAPLAFVAFGYVIGIDGFNIASFDVDHSAIHFIAEITLVLILFTDAARINLSRIRRDHNLPIRMLAIGMPLTIIAGTLVATLFFPRRWTFVAQRNWLQAAGCAPRRPGMERQ